MSMSPTGEVNGDELLAGSRAGVGGAGGTSAGGTRRRVDHRSRIRPTQGLAPAVGTRGGGGDPRVGTPEENHHGHGLTGYTLHASGSPRPLHGKSRSRQLGTPRPRRTDLRSGARADSGGPTGG